MDFSVTILGSGAAIPTSRRNPSGHYIQCRNRHLLIDCAEGTQTQLRKFGINFQRIDHIFISHLHGDHFFGLIGLLSTMSLMGRAKIIHIYGPVGLKEIIQLQIEYSKGELSFELDFTEIPSGTNKILFEDEKIEVHCFPLKHKIPTSGFIVIEKKREHTLLIDKCKREGVKIEHYHKLKKGEDAIDEDGRVFSYKEFTKPGLPSRSYAYCSDTTFAKTTIDAVQGVNLLYHEATFTELMRDRAKATKHSTAGDAARVAFEANVGRLIIGHLSARYESGDEHIEEARSIFEHVSCVEDGDEIEVI